MFSLHHAHDGVQHCCSVKWIYSVVVDNHAWLVCLICFVFLWRDVDDAVHLLQHGRDGHVGRNMAKLPQHDDLVTHWSWVSFESHGLHILCERHTLDGADELALARARLANKCDVDCVAHLDLL